MAQAFLERRQIVKSRIEYEHIDRVRRDDWSRLVQAHHRGTAATLVGVLAPGVIDENLPHHAGGHREEVRAALERQPIDVHQPHVDFMHERRGLQCVSITLVTQLGASRPAELLVDMRHEGAERLFVSLPPLDQEARQIVFAMFVCHFAGLSAEQRSGVAKAGLFKALAASVAAIIGQAVESLCDNEPLMRREAEGAPLLFNETTFRASDGAQICYRAAGNGPLTLLFLHGWGGNGTGTFWNDALAHLDPAGVRLVLADLRGHGRSEPARDGFTTERFADDLFEVADHAGATELVVVAFSMSGRWAQWMACARPVRVRAQILIGPAPAIALPLTEDVLDEWIRARATRGSFEKFIGQFTRTPLSTETVDEYYASVQATPELSLRESYRMCTHAGFSNRLETIQARTLVVAGAHDPMLPPDLLREEIVRKTPAARLAVLDCGHEIPLEQPRETAALIQAFVAGVGS